MITRAQSTAARYALAILMVAIALAVARLLPFVPVPTALFFAAVLVAAWYGGLGPGLLATALAIIVIDYVQQPAGSPRANSEHLERLLLFAALAALAAWHQASRQKALAWEHAAHLESRKAMQQKDHFLALLGHELRSPLAALSGALAISRRTADADTLCWLQGVLDRQVAHMTRLTDDLLDVSRIGRGKLTLRLARVDLTALVRGVAEDSRTTSESGGLNLQLDIPAGPLWIDGDPTRLRQVVSNLLGNAIKFTDPGGSVVIRLLTRADEALAQLIVQDTGIGIRADMTDHLFKAYVQGDEGPTRGRGGLGLGLALVKGVVERHGGTITAFSEGPGRGSTMTVLLPLAAPHNRGESSEPPRQPLVASDTGVRPIRESISRSKA